jgi:hypothetical protein
MFGGRGWLGLTLNSESKDTNIWFILVQAGALVQCSVDRSIDITTGIQGFAECRPLCRVPFVGHSAKKALPSSGGSKIESKEGL